MKELGQEIPQALSDLMVQNNGGLVLAFLAHFPAHDLAEDANLTDKLKGAVEGDPYAGPHWPLVLELAFLKQGDPSWFDPKRHFADLLIFGLSSLIEWDAFDSGSSGRAIENYGSDYENEEDNDEEGDIDVNDIL